MTKPKSSLELSRDLAAIHRELGIPIDYAAARKLTLQPEPPESDLVEVGMNPDGRVVRLVRTAAEAWAHLRDSAALDGIVLTPISGFRPIARQIEIIREKLAGGARIDDVLRFVAAPGFSEHHTGCAIDIGSPEHIELDEEFARTAAFRWLQARANEFRFRLSYPKDNPHGIGYEPWHWCWCDADVR